MCEIIDSLIPTSGGKHSKTGWKIHSLAYWAMPFYQESIQLLSPFSSEKEHSKINTAFEANIIKKKMAGNSNAKEWSTKQLVLGCCSRSSDTGYKSL